MPEPASRFAFYDQSEDRDVADWGGDDLFRRMPRPRVVDASRPARPRAPVVASPARPSEAPEPRLVLVGSPGPGGGAAAPERAAGQDLVVAAGAGPESTALAVVVAPPVDAAPRIPAGWAPVERDASGRRTAVITGHPDDRRMPRPRPRPAAAARRQRRWSPADWVVARPERLVAWAFVLGLLLILIAISTADAATL
jgi:hypothetical protein